MAVTADTQMSETRMPSEGMLAECVDEAFKSMSKATEPPFPSVIVRRGEPVVVLT